jgi:hypothetical protein
MEKKRKSLTTTCAVLPCLRRSHGPFVREGLLRKHGMDMGEGVVVALGEMRYLGS